MFPEILSIAMSHDGRERNPELLLVFVPDETTVEMAVRLRDALQPFWPTREVRVFEEEARPTAPHRLV